MLVAGSKAAAALRPLVHPAARGLAGSSSAWQRPGAGRGERAADAYRAVEDLAAAAQDSVKHASEGDIGSAAQDAVRMAEAGGRGAAESARLAFERLTGLSTTSGNEGGTAGQVAAAAAQASARAADSLAQGAADVAHDASAAYSQTVGSMTSTSTPSGNKGPESTYNEHVLRGAGVRGVGGSPNDATTATVCSVGDWAGVMVQSAADESAATGGAAGGEDIGSTGKGSGAGGAGFAGPDASAGAAAFGSAEDEYALRSSGRPGSDSAGPEGSGGGKEGRRGTASGGTVSERSARDEEFAVSKE